MSNNTEHINVYFDYTCPWVRQAGYWLINLEELSLVEINWKPYLLEQQNSENGENWYAWEQDLDNYVSRGIWPHLGGIAARKISKQAGYEYMKKIFHLKHVDRKDVRSKDYIIEIVKDLGLFSDSFLSDMLSQDTLSYIAESHNDASEKGIFGTPTIEFEDGNSVFLKTFTPPEADSKKFYESLKMLSYNNTYFGELKKPQPPWPKQHSI